MENASKALIIAGAILLSILIIGLGMFIYQQAAGTMTNANLNTEKAQAYNNKFLQYDGIQSGSSVRQLCSTVIAHNTSGATDSSEFIQVITGDATTLTTNGADGDTLPPTMNQAITTVRNGIRSGKRYQTTFGYDLTTGYVVAIGIQEVNANNEPIE